MYRIITLILLTCSAWCADPPVGLGPVPVTSAAPSGAAGGGLGGSYPNPTLAQALDGSFTVDNTADTTKAIAFSLGGATTGTTLTLVSSQTASHNLTIPPLSGNDTVATLAVANTFTATNAFAALTATSVTDSGVSVGQIMYAGTGGLLTGNSNFIISTGNFDPRTIGGSWESYKDATPTKGVAIGHHSLAGGSVTSAVNLDYYNGASWVNNSTFTDTTWTFNTGVIVTIPSGSYNLLTSTANGSVACVFTPTDGPAGASTSIVGWETFKVAGVTHYRPYW